MQPAARRGKVGARVRSARSGVLKIHAIRAWPWSWDIGLALVFTRAAIIRPPATVSSRAEMSTRMRTPPMIARFQRRRVAGRPRGLYSRCPQPGLGASAPRRKIHDNDVGAAACCRWLRLNGIRQARERTIDFGGIKGCLIVLVSELLTADTRMQRDTSAVPNARLAAPRPEVRMNGWISWEAAPRSPPASMADDCCRSPGICRACLP